MADSTDFKGSDIIDVRDIIARVEELRESVEGEVVIQDEYEELKTLEELLSNLCGYGGDEQWEGDWYPVTLIARSYFVDYCEEMVKDIGDLPQNIPSYLAIDWQATADNLEVDYSTVDFDGDEYLYR